MERKKKTYFCSFKPFPREFVWTKCLIVGLATDKGIWLLRAEGRGRREARGPRRGADKQWKILKTNSECFAILAAVLTSHAPSLISWPICSDRGWLLLSVLMIWYSWEVLLSNILLRSPHKHIHTCQTKFGNCGRLIMGMVFRAPQLQFIDSSWQGGSSPWVQSASVRRQGHLSDSSDNLPLSCVERECCLGLCLVG